MKTICFTGMDGSGKSTQCGILAKRLRYSGVEVEVIHILTSGNTVSSRIQEKPLFRIFHRWMKNLPYRGLLGGIKLAIGLISFFTDAWVTNIHYRLKYGKKLVIYDRFFYDQLVNFAASFPKPPWGVINFAKTLPKSNVTIIMEVSPEIGNMRKPEDSIEKLLKYSKFYRLLASILNVEIIDGTQDVEVVANCIFQRCAKLITPNI